MSRPPAHVILAPLARERAASEPVALSAVGAAPFALFGIDNEGFGIAANLLVIFLIAIWLALVYWAFSDARRRLQDPVLIGSAAIAALIFPFAGALFYAIVRPPETLDDAYERDLDIRAAELRVRLLEQAVKAGPGSGQFAATVAGELTGEPGSRGSAAQPTRRVPERPAPAQQNHASPSPRSGAGGVPARPSQSSPPRNPAGRPPGAGA